jgi:hypothetical protein
MKIFFSGRLHIKQFSYTRNWLNSIFQPISHQSSLAIGSVKVVLLVSFLTPLLVSLLAAFGGGFQPNCKNRNPNRKPPGAKNGQL